MHVELPKQMDLPPLSAAQADYHFVDGANIPLLGVFQSTGRQLFEHLHSFRTKAEIVRVDGLSCNSLHHFIFYSHYRKLTGTHQFLSNFLQTRSAVSFRVMFRSLKCQFTSLHPAPCLLSVKGRRGIHLWCLRIHFRSSRVKINREYVASKTELKPELPLCGDAIWDQRGMLIFTASAIKFAHFQPLSPKETTQEDHN